MESLLAQAQACVDRKYVVRADERQKAMGLGYVTAERTDLAREIASFTAQQTAALEAKLAESEKRINALRSAVRAEGYA
ncbi:hypothetical protein [Bradyrhizobium barranii]|uniref:Uncharacterized protein n=1 Tax=Bradyrhizobium barranii subsp. barranii TaxID=2823807 RepID=A0A7Z0QM04_9BRAD|nr:hypothetical protein [Bradyrhizobium barranii]UGX97371.1 hypothetical protein G6321_00020475 [Bradyrhizobium barranii subsp. barranii]